MNPGRTATGNVILVWSYDAKAGLANHYNLRIDLLENGIIKAKVGHGPTTVVVLHHIAYLNQP